ncbi:hypothetical protein HID58_033780 [Brassica napus]|uniref:RNase H type-1 domain-containing protein n=1 Tax=Brassica napus TaxID=3708 RepID=A0ABQ8C071_BRANA|nr:hypothetical protein HID58_033780 [Brassica napus]
MLEEERPEEQENSDPAVNTHVRTGNQCQVDTSWVYEGRGTGLGFVSWEGGNRSIMGLKNCRQTASPLHAEAEADLRSGRMAVYGTTDGRDKSDNFSVSHIPRGSNSRADCLAKAAQRVHVLISLIMFVWRLMFGWFM